MSREKMKDKYFKTLLYEIAGISKQAYFQHLSQKTKAQQDAAFILSLVDKKRKDHKKMGSRPLFYALKLDGIGINKFEKLLSSNGYSISQKRKRIITTQGFHEDSDVNLINGFELTGINQVIVGDITFIIQVGIQTFYVFTLKDAYSKMIVGLVGSDNMLADNAIKALKQVITLRKKENLRGTIHHTDAGSQYKATAYKKLIADCQMRRSIAGDCLQNGMAEQLNDVLKNNYLLNEQITTVEQLNRVLDKIKKMINEQRPVAALGYRTPVEFENWIKDLPVEERPSMKMYDFTQPKEKGELWGGISNKEVP